MSRLFWFAILVALAAMLACSEATPTPRPTPIPTATSIPTATPAPTWTPIPTPTTVPTPTTAPTATPRPASAQPQQAMEGGLAPLDLSDPFALATELSESEIACVTGVADVDNLLQMLESLDSVSPEEQAQVLDCLEDETLLRIFLTGLISQTAPLSVETSACIVIGMEGIDLRSVMVGGAMGDEEAAMIGGLSAMFVTMSCLNEEEFEATAGALDLNPEDRESFQCVVQQLGGPEVMAQTLSSDGEAGFMAILGAAIGCDLQLEQMAPGG